MLTLKVASMLLLAFFCLHAALALPLPNHDDIIASRGTGPAKPDDHTQRIQKTRLVARDATEPVPVLHKRIEVQRSAPALLALDQVGVRADATSLRQAAVMDKRSETSRTKVDDMQASSKADELKARYEVSSSVVPCDGGWCYGTSKLGWGTTWRGLGLAASQSTKERPQ